MLRVVFIAGVSLALLAAGCSDPVSLSGSEDEEETVDPETSTEVILEPDRRTFDLTESGEEEDYILETHLVNTSNVPLYFLAHSDDPITLQYRVNEEWKDLGAWYPTLDPEPRITPLAVGGSLPEIALTLDLKAHKEHMVEDTGDYRIHYMIFEDKEAEELIPEPLRVTDTFEVIVE